MTLNVKHLELNNLGRCSEIYIPINGHVPLKVYLKNDDGSMVCSSVGQNFCKLFEDKIVLMTMSKNNELVWIKDWLEINRDLNGVSAVLLYDNGSTKYSLL